MELACDCYCTLGISTTYEYRTRQCTYFYSLSAHIRVSRPSKDFLGLLIRALGSGRIEHLPMRDVSTEDTTAQTEMLCPSSQRSKNRASSAAVSLCKHPDMCVLDKLMNAVVLKPMTRPLRHLPSHQPLPSAIARARKMGDKAAEMTYKKVTRGWTLSTINVPQKDCKDATIEVIMHIRTPKRGAQQPTTKPSLFLYLHGGGYTLGCHKDALGCVMANTIYTLHGTECAFASVSYRLAPEHPAPAACLDAIAAFEYFLAQDVADQFGYDASRLHLYGISAGAGIAYSAGAALCRQGLASRIGSIFLDCPMSNPIANTNSYKRNTNTYLPVPWLHWSWDAYGGPDRAAAASNPMICPHGSPGGVSDMRGVAIVLVTCKADPLHDDGVAIRDALDTAGSLVSHWDLPSSHCMHFVMQPRATDGVYARLAALLRSTPVAAFSQPAAPTRGDSRRSSIASTRRDSQRLSIAMAMIARRSPL